MRIPIYVDDDFHVENYIEYQPVYYVTKGAWNLWINRAVRPSTFYRVIYMSPKIVFYVNETYASTVSERYSNYRIQGPVKFNREHRLWDGTP